MEAPKISTVLIDEGRDCRFIVLAYRELSKQELVGTVGAYLAQKRGRVRRGSTVRIITVIGARDAA